MQYTTSQLEFIAPVSFLNPTLGNTFQPILIDSINSVQKVLLQRLGLTEKIYKNEILPKLLLTLDYRRLSDDDTVQLGQIVSVHCTASQNKKFERAILARIVKIMKSRDGANRVVELEYFKARDCKMEGDKLVGTNWSHGCVKLLKLSREAI